MLLVVCATDGEADAVLAGLSGPVEATAVGPYDARSVGAVTCLVGGVGPAPAAAATATALALGPYDAVLCAGIAGGFDLDAGALVVAAQCVPADVGVRDGAHWRTLAEPLGSDGAALAAALGATCGPVLTVSQVTATDARAGELRRLFPGVVAEAMEGYGIACAAVALGIPSYELRAISNPVGQRNRASWRVGEALAALTGAMPAVAAHLDPS